MAKPEKEVTKSKAKSEDAGEEKVDKKTKIAKLLKQLAALTPEDAGEKRKIRAKLRSLGHEGGLPAEMRPERPKKAKADKKAKGKDADDDDDDDEDEKPAKKGKASKRAKDDDDDDADDDD